MKSLTTGIDMPFKKRGKYYYRKGRRYTLSQIRAYYFNKKRKGRKRR